MKLLSWLVYLPLQLVALPFAIIGAALVSYRQLVVSRRLGVSQTAIEVLNGRWTLHVFGMRDDPATERLGRSLPNASITGLWLALFPLWVKSKVAGAPAIYPRWVEEGHETVADLVASRTVYFDRMLERRLPQVDQFVLLGAGMDTRAYGVLDLSGLTVFELDQQHTQQLKRAALTKAGIDASHVTFVTVDFSTENMFEKLLEAGYDPHRKALFLWEGVTLYLPEEAVLETMSGIRANAATGSVLLADIYAARFIALMNLRGARQTLEYTNEVGNFSLPFAREWESALHDFVDRASLTLGETAFLGSTSDKGPFAVVAEMRVEAG